MILSLCGFGCSSSGFYLGFCGLGGAAVAALLGVLGGIFVVAESEEADDFLVATICGLKFLDEIRICLELYHCVEAC